MESSNRSRNAATIAFTLPISCQICLGKVKQPVVCSNQHVFCAPCMEVWLQRNQQCPTCRVKVCSENPIRHVLGGLSSQADDGEQFSNRELRRARMELIYKDYEELIGQLEGELHASKQENKELKVKLQSQGVMDTKSKGLMPASPPDKTVIMSLNNKIRDATALYDKVKAELKELKEENVVLRNKHEDITRENRTLRLELANRSPRRHGRITVAALESQVESCEKQVNQLQKALQRTDTYVEELEKELEGYRKSATKVKEEKEKEPLDLDSTINADESVEMLSQISSVSDDLVDYRYRDTGKKKRLEQSLDEDKNMSFNLEMPSPMTTASSKHLNDSEISDDSFFEPKPKTKADLCKKKLRFALPSPPPMSAKPSLIAPADDLNISMTPEMEDCMRLMDEAQEKLTRQQKSPSAASIATSFPLSFKALPTTSVPQSTYSSSSSVVRSHAATTALLMDANPVSLSQPSTSASLSVPGLSFHLSQ